MPGRPSAAVVRTDPRIRERMTTARRDLMAVLPLGAGILPRGAPTEQEAPRPFPETRARPQPSRQALYLAARYCRVQLADPKNLLLLLAQAPVIALLIA